MFTLCVCVWVHLMWFQWLHSFHTRTPTLTLLVSMQSESREISQHKPLSDPPCPSTATHTRNMVLEQFCVSEKIFVLEFQSIWPSKMCPGSRRKWVSLCAVPCFFGARPLQKIRRDGLRGPSWLFCARLLFHPSIPSRFIALRFFFACCFSSTRLCLPLMSSLRDCIFLTVSLSIFCPPYLLGPPSPRLRSRASILRVWAREVSQFTENGKSIFIWWTLFAKKTPAEA